MSLFLVVSIGFFFAAYNGWQNRQIMLKLASSSSSSSSADKSRNTHNNNSNATMMTIEKNEHKQLWSELEQLKLELAAGNNNVAKDQQEQEDVQQLRTQLDAVKKELEAEKQKDKKALDSVEKEDNGETVDGLKKEVEALKAKLEAQKEATMAKEPELLPTKKANITTYWPSSLILDKTLEWDPTVYRPWLDKSIDPMLRPPAMILMTSYGWNQPDQQEGIQMVRSIRESDLYTGVINHPWFHPTLWNDIENGTVDIADIPHDTKFFVFVDMPQCGEGNWPIYGGGKANNDFEYGRGNKSNHFFLHPLKAMKEGKLFQEKDRYNITATTVAFNCGGFGSPALDNGHNRINGTLANWPMSVVSLSSLIQHSDEQYDQGLIAPAGKPVTLSQQQEWDIVTCEAETKRSLYVTYAGNFRGGRGGKFHARGAFQPLNDNERLFIARYFNGGEFNQSKLSQYSYEEFLADTVFALAPRGDNKFSYRFTEVLSAGAIPVVLADDWVWPFRPELVDWKQCAVILPEKDAGAAAIAYLDSISEEERCRMRQACRTIYKYYVETPVKQIDGIVKGLVWKDTKGWDTMKLQGIRCDTFEDPDECNLMRRRRR